MPQHTGHVTVFVQVTSQDNTCTGKYLLDR